MMRMLKKRFILFTMTAVTALLLFLICTINGLNWIMLDEQSDRIMEMLVMTEGGGQHPDAESPPPFDGKMKMDTLRAARFFILRSNAEGQIVDVNLENISAVDAETAEEYARRIYETGNESGWIDGYKFAVQNLDIGQLTIVMDASDQRGNFYMVLTVSCTIAVMCWIVVLLIAFLLSGKIVRPILAGLEKQKQFITNAGHELKTPMAIIQSNNDAMSLVYGENKYNVHIRNQINRLNALTTDLLTLSRLDEEVALPVEMVNVSELAFALLPVWQDSAAMRNLSFSVCLAEDIFVQTNRDGMRQLLTILLDNAVKYTPDGGEILLILKKHGGHVYLIEENTCAPCHKDAPERLFERFYRGDSVRTQDTEHTGYGIGLSVARAICENVGGKLTAQYPVEDRIRFTARF